MKIYEIVKKLVGKIEPVGETNTDTQRFENLQIAANLVNALLKDIDNVVIYKDRPEYSMQKAGKFASNFFDKIGISE